MCQAIVLPTETVLAGEGISGAGHPPWLLKEMGSTLCLGTLGGGTPSAKVEGSLVCVPWGAGPCLFLILSYSAVGQGPRQGR